MRKDTSKQILGKLDQILKVLSVQIGMNLGLTERVRLLKKVGLDNHATADVLNVSVGTVRVLTSKRWRRTNSILKYPHG
jgi:hypothetical protein